MLLIQKHAFLTEKYDSRYARTLSELGLWKASEKHVSFWRSALCTFGSEVGSRLFISRHLVVLSLVISFTDGPPS